MTNWRGVVEVPKLTPTSAGFHAVDKGNVDAGRAGAEVRYGLRSGRRPSDAQANGRPNAVPCNTCRRSASHLRVILRVNFWSLVLGA